MAEITEETWKKIRDAYRTTQMKVRAIARMYDVSHTIINRRIKEEEWERDLVPLVHDQAQRILALEGAEGKDEDEAVQLAAEKRADIVRDQRNRIDELNRLIASERRLLAAKVEAAATAKFGVDNKNLSVIAQLSESLTRKEKMLQTMEREAHGFALPGQDEETSNANVGPNGERDVSDLAGEVAKLLAGGS